MFVDVWRTQKGYALAENQCAVESFYTIDDVQLAGLKAEGLIEADIPAQPAVKAGLAVPMWAWALILGLVGFVAMKARTKKARKSGRQQLLGDVSPAAMAIIDAMCHVSKADGDVSASEVREIAVAVEQMTGEAIDPSRVSEMANLAEQTLTDGDFKKFAAGRSADEKEVMMRGVLYVAVADGQLDGKEQQFVGKLAQAMKMPGDKVAALLQEVVASRSGPAAAS
jgi:tellurite resistance protein